MDLKISYELNQSGKKSNRYYAVLYLVWLAMKLSMAHTLLP